MKICSNCHIEKSLEDFYHDKNKGDGHSYVCKKCDNSRIRKDNRKGRWKVDEVKEYQKEYQSKYYINNKEKYLLMGYKSQDKKHNLDCDLTVQWIIDNITSKPCNYCGNMINIGCDRIDNNKGHTKDNVISCCTICNSARNNNFSVSEMKKIGKVIKQIMEEREVARGN